MIKARTILCIQSSSDELKIETVKAMLPFEPTTFWQKGSQMFNLNGPVPNAKYRTSRWNYEDFSFDAEKIIVIQDAIVPILKLFLPYKAQLLQIKDIGFETYLEIVINLYSHEDRPLLGLNSYCIKALDELGLEISFGLYRY